MVYAWWNGMDCQGKNSPQTPLYSRPPWNTDGKPPAFGVGQRFPPNSCSADPANAIRPSSGIELAVSTATQLCVPYEKTSGSVSRTVPSRRPWPRKHCDRYTQVTERTNPRQPIHSPCTDIPQNNTSSRRCAVRLYSRSSVPVIDHRPFVPHTHTLVP